MVVLTLRDVIDVKLLTVRQTAELIAISTRKVYELVTAGKLAHYRIDNSIRIAETDAVDFIAGCRIAQQPPIAVPAEDFSPRTRKPAPDQLSAKTSHLTIGPRQLALLHRGGIGISAPNGRSVG